MACSVMVVACPESNWTLSRVAESCHGKKDMPRKPKGAMALDGQTLRSWFHATEDPIPTTPEFLQSIVRALVLRIERQNPKDAILLKYHLQQIILLEERTAPIAGLLDLHHDGIQAIREDTLKELDRHLLGLVSAKARRPHHFIPVLQLQHTVLVNFLEEYKCPVVPISTQERWIADHWEKLWTVLTHFKCYCRYRAPLEKLNMEDREWTRTAGNLASLILAHIHRATPTTINKLLSHSKTNSRIDMLPT